MSKLTKEQLDALKDLAVKTAKQEGVQKLRRWTDVGDAGDDQDEDFGRIPDQYDLGPPF